MSLEVQVLDFLNCTILATAQYESTSAERDWYLRLSIDRLATFSEILSFQHMGIFISVTAKDN